MAAVNVPTATLETWGVRSGRNSKEIKLTLNYCMVLCCYLNKKMWQLSESFHVLCHTSAMGWPPIKKIKFGN